MSDETNLHEDLASRLILHAGSLCERFSSQTAIGGAAFEDRDAGLVLMEMATSIALFTEAAFELVENSLKVR